MKKNNKGFMLLETLIVSTFILGTLVFLYVEFSSVKRSYDISFRYNTVPGLYYARELANYLKEDGYLAIENKLSDKNYVDITSCIDSGALCQKIVKSMGAKKIIYIGDNIELLKNELNGNTYDKNVFDSEFKRFVLSLGSDTTGRNRIIIEYNDLTFAAVTLGKDNTEEYDAINLIKNGGMEAGLEYWDPQTNIEVSTALNVSGNNSLRLFSQSDSYTGVIQSVSLIENHVYYASEQIYLTETPTQRNSNFDLFRVGGTISGYPEYGNINLMDLEAKQWHHLSFIFTSTVSYDYNFRPAYFYEVNEAFLDETMLIDLTATFGAGNEPDQKWCDSHISYFDGTKKLYK